MPGWWKAKLHHLKGLHLIFKSLTSTILKDLVKKQSPINMQYRPQPPPSFFLTGHSRPGLAGGGGEEGEQGLPLEFLLLYPEGEVWGRGVT